MKFEEFVYTRPNYEEVQASLELLFQQLSHSKNAGEAIRCAVEIDKIRNQYISMKNLSGLLFSIDTTNPDYVAENDYFDEYWPLYKDLTAQYYHLLLASPYLEDFRSFYGNQFIRLAECNVKTIDQSILPELQEEQRLVSSNFKLKTDAMVSFRGESMNLSTLSGYLRSSDRQTRIDAAKAYYGFFESAQQELDTTYDQLVQIRHKKALKMGYPNFVEMGYNEMTRTDYDREMVERFRRQVLQHLIPLSTKLFERQKRRLGVTELPFYDEPIKFSTGNAEPFGTPEQILQQAQGMYRDLSKETDEYFQYMRENHLIDVLPRPGKEGSGFCSYIGTYRAPFLFANFNGSSDDVNLMTHEAGHAFQHYMSRYLDTPELPFPTMETAEIHSMSMELFTLPYMERFFGEQADKYRFAQVEHALEFIPYGCAVDEFQHLVYENPDATPAERRKMWRDTEKKYLPHRSYEGFPFLDSGTWWFKQGHIFFRPFYYIDYSLAQTCAFQFLMRMEQDYPNAWNRYLQLCRLGGSRSFVDSLKSVGLRSPFEEGVVEEIAAYTEQYLDRFDDSKM